jgi:hypothetical protein
MDGGSRTGSESGITASTTLTIVELQDGARGKRTKPLLTRLLSFSSRRVDRDLRQSGMSGSAINHCYRVRTRGEPGDLGATLIEPESEKNLSKMIH